LRSSATVTKFFKTVRHRRRIHTVVTSFDSPHISP
jgi:hypothetical protein